MKTQPFHIEVIRKRERERERERRRDRRVSLFVSTGGMVIVCSSSPRARLRHYESIFVPFESVRNAGSRFFLSGETSSHGTEEVMAKTIRVREKSISYNDVHRT